MDGLYKRNPVIPVDNLFMRSTQHDFDFLDLRFQQCSARKRTKSLNSDVSKSWLEGDSIVSICDDDEKIRCKSPLCVRWTNPGRNVRRASNPCQSANNSNCDGKKRLSIPSLQIDEASLHKSHSSKTSEVITQQTDFNTPDYKEAFPLCLLESSTINLPEPLTKQVSSSFHPFDLNFIENSCT